MPAGYIADAATRERVLDGKPRHWRAWYDGRLVSNYEAPLRWVPATLTADQVREVNARNAVECELIDEALGRVLAAIDARGWGDDVDVVFTTDHGELQGDFGLLFKGPYHVDGLMRLPLIWRPARSSQPTASTVTRPVGLVDLAPTFCAIAGLPVPSWMEGRPLPIDDHDADGRGFERVLTEWDSVLFGVDVHLRTITRDGWVCTTYQPGHSHDGTEGELYDLASDPLPAHQPLGRSRLRRDPQRPARRPVGSPTAGAVAATAGRSAGLTRPRHPHARSASWLRHPFISVDHADVPPNPAAQVRGTSCSSAQPTARRERVSIPSNAPNRRWRSSPSRSNVHLSPRRSSSSSTTSGVACASRSSAAPPAPTTPSRSPSASPPPARTPGVSAPSWWRPSAPAGGPLEGDGDRWLEMSDLTSAAGVELVEWFVIGDDIHCPRDLLGEPPRWRSG